MADDDKTQQAEGGPAFAVDTIADKAVRFGCGAMLASLIVVSLVLFGLPVPFGMRGVISLGILFTGAAGLLSVIHGERVIRGLLKLISWL